MLEIPAHSMLFASIQTMGSIVVVKKVFKEMDMSYVVQVIHHPELIKEHISTN